MGDSIWYEYKLKKTLLHNVFSSPSCPRPSCPRPSCPRPSCPHALVPRALMPLSLVPSFICLRIFGGIKKRINNEKGVIGDIGERVFGDFSAKFVGVM